VHQFIRDSLAGSSMPADLVKSAKDRIEPNLLAAWFKMPLRPAAVLVPLTQREVGMQMLLTERTHTVRDHPGQVAFPGGMAEKEDKDLLATALRESEEEIGLLPSQVEVVGYLPSQAVISGYAVLPVVGFYDGDFQASIDPGEVASVFEVPLDFLRDASNLIRVDRDKNGVTLPTYEYDYDGHRIWGATALMIRMLVDVLGWLKAGAK
jgi:8-oxo-dGTP pyrophosphatase MutT (NUDIX family)